MLVKQAYNPCAHLNKGSLAYHPVDELGFFAFKGALRHGVKQPNECEKKGGELKSVDSLWHRGTRREKKVALAVRRERVGIQGLGLTGEGGEGEEGWEDERV